MRLTDTADHSPRACAVTNREDGPMVDLQVIIDRPEPTWLYLKTEVVEEAGRLVGMVPASEVNVLREDLARLGQELDDLKSTLTLAADFEERFSRERTPA